MFNRYFQRKAVAMIMVAACVASLTACGGDKVTKNQENTTAVTAATTQEAQESTTVQEETSSRSMEEARAAAEKVRQAKGQIDSEITNQENVGADGQADGTGSDTAGASDAAAVAQEAQEAQGAVAAAVSSSIGKDEQVVTVVDTVGVNSARAQYNANYAAYVELIRLTNELRASLGVAPLKMDETFCIAACKKATDYHLNNFYDGENHVIEYGSLYLLISEFHQLQEQRILPEDRRPPRRCLMIGRILQFIMKTWLIRFIQGLALEAVDIHGSSSLLINTRHHQFF